jgi:hypothetical protein
MNIQSFIEQFKDNQPLPQKELQSIEHLFVDEVKKLQNFRENPEQLIAVQRQIDVALDHMTTNTSLWQGFLAHLLSTNPSLLSFLISFRFYTLKRLANLVTEMPLWDLQNSLSQDAADQLFSLLRTHISKVFQKLRQSESSPSEFIDKWRSLKKFENDEIHERMRGYLDELRYSLINEKFVQFKIHELTSEDFEVLTYELLLDYKSELKKMFISKIVMGYQNEMMSLGITAFPEKVLQWCIKYGEQLEDPSWFLEIQKRLLASFLLEGQVSDLSMKRVKWLASHDENQYFDDGLIVELRQRYLAVSRLNEIYKTLEVTNPIIKADDIFKPKQDEVLRQTIQQHIREQVKMRNLELTKHRRIICLAFFNHGKYEVKPLMHFVKEYKKNNREYIQFMNWLYGDQSIKNDLDSIAQRELRTDIEWYIEVEVIPDADDNIRKLLNESEHDRIRRIAEDE